VIHIVAAEHSIKPATFVAQTFLDRHGNVFAAAGTLLAGALIIFFVDRFLVRRAATLATAVTGRAELSRDTATRLRFARRAIEATVGLIVIAIALSEFDSLDRIGHALLASSAITAAIVGFAARQTLANAVAGILLAIVQPIRIGDSVTFEDESGTVEDVGLTYTWLRTGTDARLLIPNERLAGGIVRNDSIRTPTVAVEVSVWLAPDADEARALEAIRAIAGLRARLAESTHEGLRLLVMGEPGPPGERLAREGDLRATALGALRDAGLR
jgi:small conductance mechanosensitive channel